MNVEEIMQRDVATCRTVDKVARAAQLMWDHDIGCLPVVDEAGRVAGMITDRDICMAAYDRGLSLAAIPVTGAMSPQVHSCLASDLICDAEKVMMTHQVRRLPVIDGQRRVIGILSLHDIARASGKGAVPAAEVASTLAGICAPIVTAPF